MKMMYQKYTLLIAKKFFSVCFIVLIASGCNKEWLDKRPSIDVTVPSKLEDLQILLDNDQIMNLYSPGLGEIASDGHYLLTDRFLRNQDLERNAYTWSKTVPYLQNPDWLALGNYGTYARVFYCNLILETLRKIRPSSSTETEQFNNIKGQALFQRGRSFYELAQVYAPPYSQTAVEAELGIPLRLESDISIPTTRASLDQTYGQLISDLQTAKNLLAATPLYKTRASKPAACALLARIFLSIGDYDNAWKNANEALNLYNTLLDYNELNATLSSPIPRNNAEVIFHSSMASYISYGSNLLIEPELYALYEPNDLRKSVFFGSNANGTTYKGSYNGNFNGLRNFNGLATDELYLIRAECYARDNKVLEAMNDLNTLLRTRWRKVNGINTYIAQTASDAEDALRKILTERKKELLIRGLRWSDSRRLNKDPRFSVTISRTIAGNTYVLEPNSYKYTFPIPDDLIEMTGIIQNDGWNR